MLTCSSSLSPFPFSSSAGQLCGKYGPNGYTFHDANGMPLVNPARFPDFISMTTYAHNLNLTAGWYGNNCICSDHCSDDTCYLGDVDATLSFGFDSIKLDGCGAQRDLQKYADLFNASGKSILIENCHWGGTVPNATWCPWNYYRSSGDICANYGCVVNNLQTTVQWAMSGLSYPGCWACECNNNNRKPILQVTEVVAFFSLTLHSFLSFDFTLLQTPTCSRPVCASTRAA